MRFSKEVFVQFRELEHELMISPTPLVNDDGSVIAMPAMRVVPDVNLYNHLWVQKYAVAEAAYQIGANLSLYDGFVLPGGGRFNSEYYINRGETQREKLEEELMMGKYGTEYSGGIFLTG